MEKIVIIKGDPEKVPEPWGDPFPRAVDVAPDYPGETTDQPNAETDSNKPNPYLWNP